MGSLRKFVKYANAQPNHRRNKEYRLTPLLKQAVRVHGHCKEAAARDKLLKLLEKVIEGR